jgi:hypothetical protein
MKTLLVMLIEKANHPWWTLRWSKGDPPEEREGMFILSRIFTMISHKIKEVTDETKDDTRP